MQNAFYWRKWLHMTIGSFFKNHIIFLCLQFLPFPTILQWKKAHKILQIASQFLRKATANQAFLAAVITKKPQKSWRDWVLHLKSENIIRCHSFWHCVLGKIILKNSDFIFCHNPAVQHTELCYAFTYITCYVMLHIYESVCKHEWLQRLV